MQQKSLGKMWLELYPAEKDLMDLMIFKVFSDLSDSMIYLFPLSKQ